VLFLEYTKTVLKDLLLPPAGPLLLAMIAALALRCWPRLSRLLLACGLLCLWLLCLPSVADELARVIQRYPPLDLSRPSGARAILILGGGGQHEDEPEYGGPAAGPYLLEKLAYGAYVARRTGLPILVTGWHGEAAAMRDSLQRNFGLSPRWVDAQAYDTFENARNAAHILRAAGVQRVILVTTSLHMWRASQECRAAGLSVVPAPMAVQGPPERSNQLAVLDYIPDAQALVRSTAALYELLGEQVRVFLAATHLRRQQA